MTQLIQTDNTEQTLHVRFEGRSEELSLKTLNLSRDSSDALVKRALTAHFDRPDGYFERFVVVHTSQAVIVRPEAIYG